MINISDISRSLAVALLIKLLDEVSLKCYHTKSRRTSGCKSQYPRSFEIRKYLQKIFWFPLFAAPAARLLHFGNFVFNSIIINFYSHYRRQRLSRPKVLKVCYRLLVIWRAYPCTNKNVCPNRIKCSCNLSSML